MSQRRMSILVNEDCHLGWSLVECRQKCLEEFKELIEQDYIWIQEVLVEIKKKFNSPEVHLCPKTPSASRKRNARSRKQNNAIEEERSTRPSQRNTRRGKGSQRGNEDDADNTANSVASIDNEIEGNNSVRSTRSTRSNKAGSVKTGTRNTRNTKVKDEDESGPEPIMTLVPKEVSFKPNHIKSPEDNESEHIHEASVIIIETDSDSEDVKPPAKRNRSCDGKSNTKGKLNSHSTTDEDTVDSEEQEVEKTKHRSSRHSIKEDAQNSFAERQKRPSTTYSVDESPEKTTTPSCKSQSNCTRDSPRTIPNFSVLNVKAKAQAYQEFVTHGTSDSKDVVSPRPKRNLSGKEKQQPSCRSPYTTVKCKPNATQLGANKVVSVKGGGRMSLSKRRSSIVRHKMRTEVKREMALNKLNKQDKNHMNESLKSSPEKSPSSQNTPKGAKRDKQNYSSATKSSEAKRIKCDESTENTLVLQGSSETRKDTSLLKTCVITPFKVVKSPYRSKAGANSKLKLVKSNTQRSTEASSGDDCHSPIPVRSTRSKMRVQKPPPRLNECVEDEEDFYENEDMVDSSTPIQRVTRSKIRKNQKAPPSLPTPPSEEDGSSTPTMSSEERSSRKEIRSGYDRLKQESPKIYLSGSGGSVKRSRAFRDDSDDTSPPKRQCVEDTNWTSTPSQKTGPRIIKPVKGGVFSGKQPVNLNSTARSFIQRNTPKKKTTREAQEQKQKLLAQKEKEAAGRLLKREESLLKQREEARRVREQRQKAVAQRREEREKEVKLGMVKKLDNAKDTTLKLFEDKKKESEREKQRIREKKMAEAEVRRKQEEEARIQKLKEQVLEQKRMEEMQQRKREFEEKERQRRIAEQKRFEEERRLEIERERQKELERQRQLEEETRKKEETLRREREERERRERQEREKYERERQEERERIRKMEFERTKELERQRLLKQQKELQMAQKTKNEERKVLAMIHKHNNSLQQGSSLNVSSNTSLNKSGLPKPTGVKLNSSYTVPKPVIAIPQKEDDSDSYEMTPVAKKVYKSTSENYNIDDIKSDDSTDDDEAPKKKLPSWATGGILRATLINQTYQPPNLDEIFDVVIEQPDLNKMFVKKRSRFNKRTSSAIWESPILKPSGASVS